MVSDIIENIYSAMATYNIAPHIVWGSGKAWREKSRTELVESPL